MLVTGGTRGIGRATAASLARSGASVVIVGRNPHDSARAAEEITQEVGSTVVAEAADLSSLGEVRGLAARLGERTDALAAVVHNAGVLLHDYRRSPDGIEATVATHVVGPHLLTAGLRPLLEAAGGAAVIWMSSGGMYGQRLSVDDLEMTPSDYRGVLAYARAKRAQVALATQWSRRLAGSRTQVFAMHPGWVDTGALRHGLPRFRRLLGPVLRSAEEGADTAAWLAAGGNDEGSPVSFWLDRQARPDHLPFRRDPSGEGERLFSWCSKRAGMLETEVGR
jgi:dehydrogenase/reductase SDR family protein 12